MTPQDRGRLCYSSRRGAGIVHCGPIGELAARLPALRCEATLYVDGCDEPIGGVVDLGARGWSDDRRVRWNWWCDSDATRAAKGGE